MLAKPEGSHFGWETTPYSVKVKLLVRESPKPCPLMQSNGGSDGELGSWGAGKLVRKYD